MKTTFYLIRKMNLIGATFNIYNTVTLNNVESVQKLSNGKIKKVTASDGSLEICSYYEISEKPIGYNMEELSLLPYFANVIEDLPGSCRSLEPKVYKRCQLTTDYPNNYLVFLDHATNEKLKIAMNSHYYEPCN